MLKVYTLENRTEWDKTVVTFKNYDVYYLSGYVSAFKINGDGEPMLFYYEDSGLKGINVVMKRDISQCARFKEILNADELYDFATPYGYGGWLLEGDLENSNNLFREYDNWCKNNSIVSEFVRFHPVIGNCTMSDNYYDVIQLGNTVTLDISTPEIIWENITSKNRNVIRKAEKCGVTVKNDNFCELCDVFMEIYNKTMERDSADKYYFFDKEFYSSIVHDLAQNTKVFYAEKDNKIISVAIMIYANGNLNYHLAGSLFEYRTFAPSNLLLYKAALWGCENGYRTFHLGGGVGSGEDNLFKFKKSFFRKDELTRFAIGKKIFIETKYNDLLKIRGNVPSSFFPEYRA